MKKIISVFLCAVMILSLTVSSFAVTLVKGDVNKDGTVNSTDALLILRFAVKLDETEIPLETGDMDNNGAVDSADALIILQYCVGQNKFSFKKSEITTYPDKQITISENDYIISPEEDKIISWESSDEGIAKVDENGVITAVKVGTAKITATTSYGAQASFDVKVDFPVTFDCVSELPVQVGDGTSLIEIQKTEVKFSEISTTKIGAEITISGVKISDDKGDENSDITLFNLLIYKNGAEIDSNQLRTKEIKTGDIFTVTYSCSLTAGNEYAFDFISTTA